MSQKQDKRNYEHMFSEQELKNIETDLLNDKCKLFLVINNIWAEAIFTYKENANKYVIRECLNMCLGDYDDYLTDYKDSVEIPQSFQQYIKSNLYFYRIID